MGGGEDLLTLAVIVTGIIGALAVFGAFYSLVPILNASSGDKIIWLFSLINIILALILYGKWKRYKEKNDWLKNFESYFDLIVNICLGERMLWSLIMISVILPIFIVGIQVIISIFPIMKISSLLWFGPVNIFQGILFYLTVIEVRMIDGIRYLSMNAKRCEEIGVLHTYLSLHGPKTELRF